MKQGGTSGSVFTDETMRVKLTCLLNHRAGSWLYSKPMDRSLSMDTWGSGPLQVTYEASALAPGHLPDYTEPIPHGFKGTEETPKHRAAEPVRW